MKDHFFSPKYILNPMYDNNAANKQRERQSAVLVDAESNLYRLLCERVASARGIIVMGTHIYI